MDPKEMPVVIEALLLIKSPNGKKLRKSDVEVVTPFPVLLSVH